MEEHYFSPPEIAKIIGISAQAVSKRAKKWQGGRKRQARGGGYEYPIWALPEEWREQMIAHTAHLVQQQSNQEFYGILTEQLADNGKDPTRVQPPLPLVENKLAGDSPTGDRCRETTPQTLPLQETRAVALSQPERIDAIAKKPKKQRQIEAWLEILKTRQTWCEANGIDKVVDCDIAFSEAYNNGEIRVPDWVRETIDSFSRSTIARKRKALAGGLNQLANQHQGSKKKLTTQQQEMIKAMITQYPHVGPVKIYRALAKRFEDNLPSEATVTRFVKHWKSQNKELLAAITSPDQWKGEFMAAFGSMSEGIERLNQLWEFDSTPADVMLSDGRYSLIGAIDVFSRRAKLFVSKTSKGTAIIALLRRCILDWGVPEIARTDNGKDYTSIYIDRVLQDLGIKQVLCPPFQPWHKPHIERFFKTFSHDIVELLDNFVGHNVAQRQKIRDRKSFSERMFKKDQAIALDMTADELQNICDQWCENYHHRQHEGIGKSPFEQVAQWTQPIKTITNERALDLLLAQSSERVVSKKGIKLEGATFIAPELALIIGEPVLVRFDPIDMGRIYVFHDDEYICTAECPERTGIDRQRVAREATRRQRESIQAQKKALKQVAKQHKVGTIAEEMLAAETRKNQGLVAMPKQTIDHQTEELIRAAEAVEERKVRQQQTDREGYSQWLANQQQAEQERKERESREIDTDAVVEKVFDCWVSDRTEELSHDELVIAKRCAPLPDGKAVLMWKRESPFQEKQFFWWLDEVNLPEVATG
jgi:putative transposase